MDKPESEIEFVERMARFIDPKWPEKGNDLHRLFALARRGAEMSEDPTRHPCVEALLDYQQADEDGVMVLVSRQAIHETVALLTPPPPAGETEA